MQNKHEIDERHLEYTIIQFLKKKKHAHTVKQTLKVIKATK